MRNLFIILTSILFSLSIPQALALDVANLYVFNGESKSHTYKINYPQTWQLKTYGNSKEIITSKKSPEKQFIIEEFDGQTYNQVIAYYKTPEQKVVQEDFVFNNDYLAKKITYKEGDNSTSKTLIKRGTLIVSLTTPASTDQDSNLIYESFSFTDSWHQYIDYKESFTFIFPSSLEINNIDSGVQLMDPTRFNDVIFSILKYANTTLVNAPEIAQALNDKYQSQEKLVFHGIEKAIKAIYRDIRVGKDFSRIFVQNSNHTYAITNTNEENNFPHYDYYDDYITEIIESFEFFNIIPENKQLFSDLKNTHKNYDAIKSLNEEEIIKGYKDKTFRPNAEINRAELTKLIVAAVAKPNATKYKNCFSDVKEQWFAPYICYAKDQKWLDGYENGAFNPEQKINRAEAIKIVISVLFGKTESEQNTDYKPPLDINNEDWYYEYFNFADKKKLLYMQHIRETKNGYYFYPGQNITRKEVAELIYRAKK